MNIYIYIYIYINISKYKYTYICVCVCLLIYCNPLRGARLPGCDQRREMLASVEMCLCPCAIRAPVGQAAGQAVVRQAERGRADSRENGVRGKGFGGIRGKSRRVSAGSCNRTR